MKLSSFITAILLAASLVFGVPSVQAGPAFPGQPHINSALKHLNAAKEKVTTDSAAALNELQAAHGDLAHSVHNKGTYINIARELTDQATQYLEKGDVEKATHKIDEAIEATNHAGETGDH